MNELLIRPGSTGEKRGTALMMITGVSHAGPMMASSRDDPVKGRASAKTGANGVGTDLGR